MSGSRRTDSREKSAIIWQFGQAHGVTPLTGTFDELAEQGYIDREGLYWKDGVLFSIKENYGHDTECYSLPVLHFDAQKWRSGLGPISSLTAPLSGRRADRGRITPWEARPSPERSAWESRIKSGQMQGV